MHLKVIRQDSSEVNVSKLLQKILEKMEQRDEAQEILCAQATIGFSEAFTKIPVVGALLTLNQQISQVFSLFLQAGYLLGSAVEKNQLQIIVEKGDNDNIPANNQTIPSTDTTNSN